MLKHAILKVNVNLILQFTRPLIAKKIKTAWGENVLVVHQRHNLQAQRK